MPPTYFTHPLGRSGKGGVGRAHALLPSLYDYRLTHLSLPSFPPSLLTPVSYIAVNPAIGLKRRGAKGRVELKVLTEEGKEEEGDIKGIEQWKKYKASG
jgi:hypothetical protein